MNLFHIKISISYLILIQGCVFHSSVLQHYFWMYHVNNHVPFTIQFTFWNAVLSVLLLGSHGFNCMHSKNALFYFIFFLFSLWRWGKRLYVTCGMLFASFKQWWYALLEELSFPVIIDLHGCHGITCKITAAGKYGNRQVTTVLNLGLFVHHILKLSCIFQLGS